MGVQPHHRAACMSYLSIGCSRCEYRRLATERRHARLSSADGATRSSLPGPQTRPGRPLNWIVETVRRLSVAALGADDARHRARQPRAPSPVRRQTQLVRRLPLRAGSRASGSIRRPGGRAGSDARTGGVCHPAGLTPSVPRPVKPLEIAMVTAPKGRPAATICTSRSWNALKDLVLCLLSDAESLRFSSPHWPVPWDRRRRRPSSWRDDASSAGFASRSCTQVKLIDRRQRPSACWAVAALHRRDLCQSPCPRRAASSVARTPVMPPSGWAIRRAILHNGQRDGCGSGSPVCG